MSWGSGTLTSRPQVRERDLPFVTHTLSSEFTILRVVNGETVAAENLSITNGFVKPKMGELGWRGVPPSRKAWLSESAWCSLDSVWSSPQGPEKAPVSAQLMVSG